MSLQKLGFCVKIMVFKSRGQSTTWLRLWRSLGCKLTNTTQNMAALASKPKRRGGRYCVAGAPNNHSFQNTLFSPGITVHQFPTDAVLRKKWIKFVQRHQRDFKLEGKYTSLCSAHFVASCYNTDESNINKRISTNAWYNYCKSAFFSVSILILSRDKCFLLYLKLKLSFMGTDRSLLGPLNFGMHYS